MKPKKIETLFKKILNNKIITVCILFTIFTMLDTIPILIGLWPPKTGINAYVHLLGRFFLHSILITGLWIFDKLRQSIKSKIIIYLISFVLTWELLLIYLLESSFFTELHPDAYKDMTRSYAAMYILIGIILWINNTIKTRKKISMK